MILIQEHAIHVAKLVIFQDCAQRGEIVVLLVLLVVSVVIANNSSNNADASIVDNQVT